MPFTVEGVHEGMTGLCQKAIGIVFLAYRRILSPLLPRSCRFFPSCSAYAVGAVERYGMIRGFRLGLRRLCRCHPLNEGGYDPVP